jgi:hypothetical protein
MQRRKRVNITLNAEPYEKLMELAKILGFRNNWLGQEIDKMIAGLLIIAEQAKRDAEEKKEMTEAEARKRYEDLMRVVLEGK